MRSWMFGLTAILALTIAQPARTAEANLACGPRVHVSYTDSSPDFFVIKNLSAEGWTLTTITIDLVGSAGDVIFDTDDDGPGVNAASSFFSAPSGPVRLLGVTPVQDGGRALALRFENFAASRKFAFFIDLDNRLETSTFGQAYVSDSEMAGSRAIATFRSQTGQPVTLNATFNSESVADTGAGGCV
ncbi:hypothetical protein MnTg02_00310 [bacterium MnTg02]|nr:hypothetical protein MnTg02_00310 [bacterium MnTg02]